jgi:protein-S-isoprenylcysteine O-methyltransferase Ste14
MRAAAGGSGGRLEQASLWQTRTTGVIMTDAAANGATATLDRPEILVFPPVIPVSTLAISCVLQWLAPLGLIDDIDQTWRIGWGVIMFSAGMLMTIVARRTLLRHGTNVNPLQPTTALVTEGIFRRTRNPLYVGIIITQYAVALIFALDWLLLLILPNWIVLHFAVVTREERYLERKFGDAYRRYKERVPRYLLSY